MRDHSYRKFLEFVVIIVVFLGCASSYGESSSTKIANYDNDPDLEKAMHYDLTLLGADPNKASRELAEKHYLAYLKKVKEPFQKARIYVCLGDLFAGRVKWPVLESVPNRDSKADWAKAVMYYRKALEAEPERIGEATINARACLGMNLPSKQKFDANLDYYEWLISSMNRDVLRTRILPWHPEGMKHPNTARIEDPDYRRAMKILREHMQKSGKPMPAPKSGLESAVDGLMKTLSSQEETTRMVLVHNVAKRARDSDQYAQLRMLQRLQKIMDRFPNSQFAEEAKREYVLLRELMDHKAAHQKP